MICFPERTLWTTIANGHIKNFFQWSTLPSHAKCHDISVVSRDQLSVKDNPFLAWREAGLTRHKLRHFCRAFSREWLFNEETTSARLNVAVICAFYWRPATKRPRRLVSRCYDVSAFREFCNATFPRSAVTKFQLCVVKQFALTLPYVTLHEVQNDSESHVRTL